jgi:hypothetical protein
MSEGKKVSTLAPSPPQGPPLRPIKVSPYAPAPQIPYTQVQVTSYGPVKGGPAGPEVGSAGVQVGPGYGGVTAVGTPFAVPSSIPVAAAPPVPGAIIWERGNLVFWITFVLILFFVVIGILFFLQVSIVTDVDSAGNVTINTQKLFLWGLLITIILLLLFWLLSKTGCYAGYARVA